MSCNNYITIIELNLRALYIQGLMVKWVIYPFLCHREHNDIWKMNVIQERIKYQDAEQLIVTSY